MPLNRDAVLKKWRQIAPYCGSADHHRFESLLPYVQVGGQLRLSDALSALYSDKDEAAAKSAFRGFRARLTTIAKSGEIDFVLNIDETRSMPAQRWCWFSTQPELKCPRPSRHPDLAVDFPVNKAYVDSLVLAEARAKRAEARLKRAKMLIYDLHKRLIDFNQAHEKIMTETLSAVQTAMTEWQRHDDDE